MNKEYISDSQGISIIILYLLGTSSMLTTGIEAKRDIWLAVLLSIFVTSLIVLVFIRLHTLFPGRNLFEICTICFGRAGGALPVILLTWYAFHSGVLALLETVFFMITTSLDRTPGIVLIIFVAVILTLVVKQGLEVIGRTANHIAVLVVAFIIIAIAALTPMMDINHLRPVLSAGAAPVVEGAFASFTFPMGEIIVIAMIFNLAKPAKAYFKIYFAGLLIGGFSILLISTASVLVLGVETAAILNYPTYAAAARINIGFLTRGAEILMAIILVSGSFIHLSVYLLGACKGLAALTKSADYRIFVVPVVLLMVNIAYSWQERVIEYFEWEGKIWSYYAAPFQVLLPILILIGAEIKSRVTPNEK